MIFRIEKKPDINLWRKLFQQNACPFNGSPDFLSTWNKSVDVWVYGDYDILIPIVKKRKYRITKAIQPIGCQKTAFLSQIKPTPAIVQTLWDTWKKHYAIIDIQCFIEWAPTQYIERNNYILDLQLDYSKLRQKFSKRRKYETTHFSNQLTINEISPKELYDFWKTYKNYGDKNLEIEVKQLLETLSAHHLANFLAVRESQEIVACLVLVNNSSRKYNLLSVSSPKGKILPAQTFAIHHVIQKYATTHSILDFEGSDIPGVASFFRSWGAVNEIYARIYWEHPMIAQAKKWYNRFKLNKIMSI